MQKVTKPKSSYLLTPAAITVLHNGAVYSIDRSNNIFDEALIAVKNGNYDEFVKITEFKQNFALELKKLNPDFTLEDGVIKFKGKALNSVVSSRIKELKDNSLPIKNLVNFVVKLSENPSSTSQKELYGFIEACDLPIDDEGFFYAYKKVRGNYTDCHTGKFMNSVGSELEMSRGDVDDNRDNTCSHGFHFCSKEYLKHFGGERIMVVKIHPKDVVSIPSDYNNSKGRACKYTVVSELEYEKPLLDQKYLNSIKDSPEENNVEEYSIKDSDNHCTQVSNKVESDELDELDAIDELTKLVTSNYTLHDAVLFMKKRGFSARRIAKIKGISRYKVHKLMNSN
jgi:hypothetical protein